MAKATDSPSSAAEVRARRLREDAQRPAATNLAGTIALSHALLRLEAAVRTG